MTTARRIRRHQACRWYAGDAVHWCRQPRSQAVRRSGASRHRPHAEPASRLRHRCASMRRDGAGAARGRDRDFAIPGAVSRLCAEWLAAARRPRPLSRISECALRRRGSRLFSDVRGLVTGRVEGEKGRQSRLGVFRPAQLLGCPRPRSACSGRSTSDSPLLAARFSSSGRSSWMTAALNVAGTADAEVGLTDWEAADRRARSRQPWRHAAAHRIHWARP